jgi:hypothetical protein
MMSVHSRHLRSTCWTMVAAAILLLTAGCAITLISDYDKKSVDDITEIAADVFTFYDHLLETPEAKRRYKPNSQTYGDIDTKIRVYLMRQEGRPLNSESVDIAKTILSEWETTRERHRRSDVYTSFLVVTHRDRYQRLFTAALNAEKAKALATASSESSGTAN